MTMLSFLVAVTIVFFFGMGLIGLAIPERIGAIFGAAHLTAEGRNEFRAVYGGFGVAIAGVLAVAWFDAALRPGLAIAVAAALFGMAGGRVVAALVERPRRFYPSWFYCSAETAMGTILWLWA